MKKNSKDKTTTETSTKTAPGQKADFIRKCAATTPAFDVAALAKKAGFSVTPNYVYSVRAEMRKKKNRAVAARLTDTHEKEATPAQAPLPPRAAVDTSPVRTVELLKAIASEIGLGDAIAILQAERARVLCLLRPVPSSVG